MVLPEMVMQSPCSRPAFSQHCGRSYEEVERDLDRDRFMTAEEAREWGLIDTVLDRRTATL
jgi:ATP-dependent Clp protease protease subunit